MRRVKNRKGLILVKFADLLLPYLHVKALRKVFKFNGHTQGIANGYTEQNVSTNVFHIIMLGLATSRVHGKSYPAFCGAIRRGIHR